MQYIIACHSVLFAWIESNINIKKNKWESSAFPPAELKLMCK